uniref:protein-tyrosine-phosphatase n=1 Tax=Lates calcarifer TaxID=8187 RepID=A0A4W6FWP2_LATCA
MSTATDIPLEVLGLVNIEQLPTITAQSPSSLIAFPFDESFPMTCEAKGNPEPEFRWTKNGQEFDPFLDPRLMKEENSGTFVIPNDGNLTEYQGTYRCYASNKLGTAISKEIEFIVPHVPKFPKETLDPLVVEEGQPFTLQCNPPKGIPPLQIYWMTINLQHIEQDERVSMGLNGDLYFSHAVEKDSRRDYCCFAAFPRIRTIVQKTAMSVIVKTTNAILERRPTLLTPSGVKSEIQLVKGEDLKLECIAEGFPTPKVEWVKMGHHLPDKAKPESHGKLLIVSAVEQEDSGKYMCKAKNTLGEVVHYFTVTVEEPPEWVSEPESQLSMIGSEVHIQCSASGTPQPTVTWKVNGVPLNEVPAANRKMFDNTIVLYNAKASDSAVYQCEASNRHGNLLSNANIMIMSKCDNLPPMILTNEGEDYSAVEGKGVMMHCKVFSSPPSTITWSKDDSSESVEGPRFTIHENGSLEIYSVEREDTGQYTCLVKNTEGSSAIDAMLYVKDPTRIVVAPEDQQILIGTTAQLSCLAEYDKSFSNDFELLWEKDDMEIALNYTENSRYLVEDGILQIINVSHGDQGVYTCVARTPVDRDMASALLLVLVMLLCWFSDVPDAPENLVLSEHKSKSVKLKWIPGDDHNSSTTDFIIEYEESQWEPGNWKELHRVPGNHNSAVLKLHGHVDYRFRVSGVNSVGRGPPSEPTERYKTPAAAPDKNPENIKIEGHLPHEMDINWEVKNRHNGPGLEYKVSYRRQDILEDWREHMVKRHSFVVKNTPTFVPYEIKIQAKNNQGWGPEPKIVTGYSGEDCNSYFLYQHNPDTTKWILRDLEPVSKYKFYLRSCTTVGCGPVVSEECTTTLETSDRISCLILILDQFHQQCTLPPSAFASDRLCRCKHSIKCPDEKAKASQSHQVFFPSGLASIHGGISTQGWFIGLMCAIALLTLIVLIACFVNRNKGGKYSVKEKEDLHPDVESQGMNDDTFCEYSDNDEKPLKGSQHSLSREIKAGDSGDSLVDYGDEDAQFNEDGSFIGEYAGRKEKRVSTEIKATVQTPA